MEPPATPLVRVLTPEDQKYREYSYGEPVRVTVWEAATGGPSGLGAGIVTYEGTFSWHFHYDIAFYVLEGTMAVDSGDTRSTATPGDVVFIARGADAAFEMHDCRAFWAIHPSNWTELSGGRAAEIID